MYKIITYPHPSLRKKARKITKDDPELKGVIQAMEKVVRQEGGLGLAANQINLLERIILVKNGDEYIPYLNPKIISHSPDLQIAKEGCLSVPDKEVAVARYKKVTVLAQNRKGRRVKIKVKELIARVFQHEIDHLNGKLIIDYEK